MIVSEISAEVSGVAIKGLFAGFSTCISILLLFYYSPKLAIVPLVFGLLSCVCSLYLGIKRVEQLSSTKRFRKVERFLVPDGDQYLEVPSSRC